MRNIGTRSIVDAYLSKVAARNTRLIDSRSALDQINDEVKKAFITRWTHYPSKTWNGDPITVEKEDPPGSGVKKQVPVDRREWIKTEFAPNGELAKMDFAGLLAALCRQATPNPTLQDDLFQHIVVGLMGYRTAFARERQRELLQQAKAAESRGDLAEATRLRDIAQDLPGMKRGSDVADFIDRYYPGMPNVPGKFKTEYMHEIRTFWDQQKKRLHREKPIVGPRDMDDDKTPEGVDIERSLGGDDDEGDGPMYGMYKPHRTPEWDRGLVYLESLTGGDRLRDLRRFLQGRTLHPRPNPTIRNLWDLFYRLFDRTYHDSALKRYPDSRDPRVKAIAEEAGVSETQVGIWRKYDLNQAIVDYAKKVGDEDMAKVLHSVDQKGKPMFPHGVHKVLQEGYSGRKPAAPKPTIVRQPRDKSKKFDPSDEF